MSERAPSRTYQRAFLTARPLAPGRAVSGTASAPRTVVSVTKPASAAIVHPPFEDDELQQRHHERDDEQADGHDRPDTQVTRRLELEDPVDERLGRVGRTARG